MVAVLGFESSLYPNLGIRELYVHLSTLHLTADLAVGVGLEPTSSRLTVERWTSSATLQKTLVGLARIELAA